MVFTDVELRNAVRHLAFDMSHFRLYAGVHEGRTHQTGLCSQAITYSLLLHFRLLLHFFYGKPKGDDCCVDHFRVLPGFDVAFPSSNPPVWEKELRQHLNKRLAHFTATRWNENAPSMNYYASHFTHVLAQISAFERAVPGEVGNHFRTHMRDWENRYQK